MASTSSFRASSSSSTPAIPRTSTYDVFLSFRGEDTRYNFTDHLYSALGRRGIHTFRDDKLRRGEAIAPELLKAIEESRSSVIVFSENYAHSRWCLDELVKIMECQKDPAHVVFPIFYHVDPSHVRKQEGSFGEAFAGYEENWKDKIPRWRRALTEAANLSGWHILDGYESNQIKEITNNIFRQLKCKRLDVGANLVGIGSRVKEMILRLHMESSDVRIVGICGVGGIEGEVSQNMNGVAHKASMIKDILSSKRVLMVLDDVDHPSQLEYLLGHREWLGEGSRVIITTRNKHVLAVQKVDNLYEVKGLNFEEDCELFSLYAFKQNLPKSDYRNLACRVVGYCQGLPLALKVLGSLLFNKTIPEWESELHKLDREPEAEIHNGFCVKNIGCCDFHAKRGIRNLNDKCLITLPYNEIRMHDLIQHMGWEIVREKFPDEPNKWSRLWDPCDFERALTAYEGIKRVETISLDLSKSKGVCVSSNVFAKTTRLRLLKVHSGFHIDHKYGDLDSEEEMYYCYGVIAHASKMQLDRGFKFPSYELRYLCWDGYPLDFLPSNFDGGKLVELHLHCSNIKRLWLGNKDLERLKVIDLSYSRKLIQMSEFSRMPNLESLFLNGCVSLIDIHPSVGNLKKLTTLSLRSCDKLKNLPDSIWDLESLEILNLSYCSKFEKFPGKGGNMKSLRKLHLKDTAIKDLPDSIGDLESLEILDLSDCSKFEKFPEKGGNMKSLNQLLLRNTAIKDLPDSIGDLESLESLDLSGSKFEKFPEKGGNMKSLNQLLLRNTAIKDLPDSIGDLESLESLDLSDCSKFEKFPEKGGNMKSLKKLRLRNTAIKDLPDSIGDLKSLEFLDLSDCSKFEKFPEKGGNMKRLRELHLKITAIKDLPTNISRLKKLKRLVLSDCSDLWEGLISNQLCNLQKLNISQCKMAGQILVLPSSLEEIDAYHCTSKEDLSGLLWLCHLNWLKSTTEELKCWKLVAVIRESNGIPEWIRYQNMGSEVTTELPTNWYEDPDFLGFVGKCYRYDSPGNFKDLIDQVCVWWYPKIAIRKEHHHKYTHINASFRGHWTEIKKCGIDLIFAGDQQNHMPMLEHPQNSGDNGSALQDTDGNVHGANQDDEHYHIPMLLDLPGNFGDIGSVILEGTDGNRKRRRDDSLPDVVEEPHYKRLGAPNTDPLL
ncbi:TMV resistance protein N [Vitis vinifera]|uniref:ADP-ribosyl cyclase/cyclic ADP-ribose hydrolase n=1 Tax=Vitis vinifera TaxID=29760 RepID=A0A438CEG9_VITVI|nr:TMV resistance protein N [Vitis vinifera]